VKTNGFVPPPDFAGPAVPVALVDTDAQHVIDHMIAAGLVGHVDANISGSAWQVTSADFRPTLMTIELARSAAQELGVDVHLLRDLDADPEGCGNFVVHPDGAFWPIPPPRLAGLAERVPTLIRADDVWLVVHRPSGRRASGPAAITTPAGIVADEPTSKEDWLTARIWATDERDPSQSLPAWSGLTALIRVTSREVTIWRAGKLPKPVLPLSWGYQRTWVTPNQGTIANNAAATAAAFASAWRHTGGSVAEATLVELHQRRRLNTGVLRPALTSLGLPTSLVSQLCAQIPTPIQAPDSAVTAAPGYGPALAS
jgi:hypothetical protein